MQELRIYRKADFFLGDKGLQTRITAQDERIDPRDARLVKLDSRLKELLGASFDETQQHRLYQLQLLLDEKVDEMINTVDLLRDNRQTDAVRLFFTHRGPLQQVDGRWHRLATYPAGDHTIIIGRVIGGGTYSRRSPFCAWFEDVRALGFLRPPWGLAYDNLFATSLDPREP